MSRNRTCNTSLPFSFLPPLFPPSLPPFLPFFFPSFPSSFSSFSMFSLVLSLSFLKDKLLRCFLQATKEGLGSTGVWEPSLRLLLCSSGQSSGFSLASGARLLWLAWVFVATTPSPGLGLHYFSVSQGLVAAPTNRERRAEHCTGENFNGIMVCGTPKRE